MTNTAIASTGPLSPGKAVPLKRVLWIAGRLPFPLRSGDALYTAGLLRAAHAAKLAVTVIGLPREPGLGIGDLRDVAAAEWYPVISEPRPVLGSLLSGLPKDAYSLHPGAMRAGLRRLLEREWDWIVVDHARSAGGLAAVMANRGARLAYVAHNVERTVRREVAAGVAGALAAPYAIDAWKYGRLESAIVDAADVVMTITEEDASAFRAMGAVAHHVPPVYLGRTVEARVLDRSTPRRVMLLGSFDWIAKQRNLVRFLEGVGERLIAAGIGLDVVGSVPKALLSRLQAAYPAVRFHGAVADVAPIADQVRCGIIPEELGGGMKMKTLDYIFMRLPVFSLSSGAIGLPAEARDQIFVASALRELGDAILRFIDDLEALNARQERAFEACKRRFSVAEASRVMQMALGS